MTIGNGSVIDTCHGILEVGKTSPCWFHTVPYSSIVFGTTTLKCTMCITFPRIQNMCVTDQTTSETINQHGIFYVLWATNIGIVSSKHGHVMWPTKTWSADFANGKPKSHRDLPLNGLKNFRSRGSLKDKYIFARMCFLDWHLFKSESHIISRFHLLWGCCAMIALELFLWTNLLIPVAFGIFLTRSESETATFRSALPNMFRSC